MEKSEPRLIIPNQKLRVSWKPVNPQDCVWKNLYRIIMRTTLQERGTIHCNVIIWYTKFIPMPQAMKIPHSKSSSGQGMGKIGENFDVEPDESQKQERGDRWSKDEGRKSSFCLTDGHLSFEECRIGGKAPKIQRSSCTPRWYYERWFWISCSIHWTRIISISNDGSKSHGYHLQIARLRGTRSGRSACLDPGKKWKMLPNYWKLPNRNVQTFGCVHHDTNGQYHGLVWKTQSFLWSEICMVILWQDYHGKGNLRKSYSYTVGRRFPIGNAYSYTVKKDYSYLCTWMTKLAGKKKNIDPMWKVLNKEVDLG